MASVSRLPSIYFEKLLESSPDIVVAVDRQGTITFYNDGARQPLGHTPDEVLGQHVTRLYPDLAEARKVMAAMRQGKNCETTFVTKSGARIPVLIAGSIIRDAEGHELGSIGFAKDLREIRRHDQLATLAEVAIGLAHEINTPLEVIVNNLNLLEAHVARVTSDEDFVVEGERLDSIHTALKRIQHIVNQLTEMAHGSEYATREYLPGTQMTDLRAGGAGADGGRAAALEPHDPALSGIRILVVDDDLGLCQSLRDLLTQPGCEVRVATGRRAAHAELPGAHFRTLDSRAVSSIGLGTYLGEEDDQIDRGYGQAIVDAANSGCNLLDTAINYRAQRSERVIGQALVALEREGGFTREQFVVCTKGGYIPFDGGVSVDPGQYVRDTYLRTGILQPEDVVGGGHAMTPRYLEDQLGRSLGNLGLAAVD